MATKVVIVTGASRGIGKAIAIELLARGSQVVLVARSKPALEQIASQQPSDVAILPADLHDLTVGPAAVALAQQKFGRLDGVVINHGQVEPVERIENANTQEWKKSFDLNVFSYVSLIQAAIPALRKTRGRIIMTSSGAATKATSAWGCYGMAKASLNYLALSLAKEEPDIVTVAVRPGVVDTEMQATLASEHFGRMEDEDAERFRRLKSEGKMLRPEQPGGVMARLVLEAPAELSGRFVNWDDEFFRKRSVTGLQSHHATLV